MLVAELFAAAAAAGGCEQDFATYDVVYLGDRLFQVEAAFAAPHTTVGVNHQPSDDRPEGQSESIRKIKAFDSAGVETAIAYKEYGDWSALEGASRISYQLVVDHDEVKWRHGADEVGHPFGGGYYFAGHAFFVGPYSEDPTCPVSVTFDAPVGWTLTAPWAADGLSGRALSMSDLHDNGFAVGPFEKVEQKVGALSLTSVYDPKLEKDVRPVITGMLNDLLPAYTGYFGGQPAAAYSTFHFSYANSDGSAFARSFALQYEWPLNLTEKPIWSHVLAHETMHLWTGVVERADHEIEWFIEGFTDYLAVKHLYREGYLDDEGLRRQLGVFVSRHQLGKRMSQGTSLRDAGLAKGDNWFLIYGSGALIALILDAEQSTAEPGAFDAMMADLFAAAGEPYDFERLISFMDNHSDGRAREVFDAVDAGLRPNDINTRLVPAGLGVAGYVDQTYISFNGKCRKRRRCAPPFLQKPR